MSNLFKKLSVTLCSRLQSRNIVLTIQKKQLIYKTLTFPPCLERPKCGPAILIRTKYSKKDSKQDEDSDDDDEAEQFKDDRDSKIVKTSINSLRMDLVLRAGLNMARNKVEVSFYESRIRVNGKKIPKKSFQLFIGDEVDVVRGFSTVNPSLLVVSRVEILSAKDKEEGFAVQLRRYKNLLIENYEGTNAFKSSESSQN